MINGEIDRRPIGAVTATPPHRTCRVEMERNDKGSRARGHNVPGLILEEDGAVLECLVNNLKPETARIPEMATTDRA